MNFSRFIKYLFVILTLYCTGPLMCFATIHHYWKAWATDLPLSPRIEWGQLPNGLTYGVMPCKEPPGKVSLRLYVQAGSLMEKDEEQGLAHFIEHLVFQGSKNFSEGIKEYLKKLGLVFGADLNAYTTFDRTVYSLDIPNNTGDDIDSALKAMYDYAHGANFSQDKIEREREVVLAEKLAMDTIGYKMGKSELSFVFKGLKYVDRMPIGQTEVIKTISRDKILNFYHKWYRPDRMVLLVVGDIETENTALKIKDILGELPSVSSKIEEPDLGKLENKKLRAKAFVDKEVSSSEVSLYTIAPYDNKAYNKLDYVQDTKLTLIDSILSLRLTKLQKLESSPFTSATALSCFQPPAFRLYGISANVANGEWEKTLATLSNELRRVLQYGFTEFEVNQAKTRLLKNLREACNTAQTMKAPELCDDILASLYQNRPYLSPLQALEVTQGILSEISTLSLHEAFKSIWGNTPPLIFVSSAENIEDLAILDTYNHSLLTPISPPQEEKMQTFAYQPSSLMGEIASQEHIQDLDIHALTFKNNIKVSLKQTDFEANTIHIGIRFGAGLLEEDPNNPGLSLLAAMAFITGGLEAHSLDDITEIYSKNILKFSFTVQDDAFVLHATTSKQDFKDAINILLAYLEHPGFRAEALQEAHKKIDILYKTSTQTPEGVFENMGRRILAGGDERFGLPSQAKLLEFSLDDLKKWLSHALKESPIELAIVGDINLQDATSSLACTFGTMPSRQKTKPLYFKERVLQFPNTTKRVELPLKTDFERGLVLFTWPTTDKSHIQEYRRLTVLNAIYSNCIIDTLRSQMGLVYSPFSFLNMPLAFPEYGYFTVGSISAPENMEVVAAQILKINHNLLENGISQEEMDLALQPILKNLEAFMRSNGYWMNTILGSQENSKQLDWCRSLIVDFNSICVEELNEMMQKYITPDKSLQLLILPQK